MNKIIFWYVTFLPTIAVASLVFYMSSSHANTKLSKRCFLHEQFLILNYPPILAILHPWSYSQSHVLGLHIKSFLQKLQSANSLYSNSDLPWLHFYFELHTFSLNLYLHLFDPRWTKNLVSFTLIIKLNPIIFIFFTLFGTHTHLYGSSISSQLPRRLLLT